GLFLSRHSARLGNIAVRVALGASRARVLRHILLEGAIISIISSLLGVTLARFAIVAIRSSASTSLPYWTEVTIDVRVLMLVLLVTALSGMVASVLTAVLLTRRDLAAILRSAGHTLAGARRRGAAQQLLVVGEIAMTVALLSASLAFGRAFLAATRRDTGMVRS